MYYDMICSGFGGQGVMVIGNLLAYAAMEEGLNVTFFPSYGVEMRGGTANCTVVISDDGIGSPIVGHPCSAIVLNKPSLRRFGPMVKQGGVLVVNSSLIKKREFTRENIEVLDVPMVDLAKEVGTDRLTNMIALGAYVGKTGVVSLASLETVMTDVFEEHYHQWIPKNIEALRRGMAFAGSGQERAQGN